MFKRRRMVLALGLVLGCNMAAAEWSNDWFRLSGFGTAAITRNTSDNTYYRLGMLQPSGARNGWDGGALNKVGAQTTLTATPWLSATAQLVSQRQYDDGYDPVFDWAFVKVKPLDSVAIRMGRLVLPGFMVSESRNVGYVNTMVTPPIDVYTLLPLTKFDGLDLNWRIHAGPVTVNLTPYLGRRREPISGGTVLQLDKIRGLNSTAEWESWTFRAGVTLAELQSPNESARALWECMRGESTTVSAGCPAYAAAVPGAAAVAAEYEIQHKDASFAGLGVQYDDGDLLGAAEYVQRKTKSYIPDATAWYLMGGYRVQRFTPYVAYSRLRNESPTSDGRLAALGGGALGTALSAQVNTVLSSLAADQKTLSLGVRWDFRPDAALKFQYDHVKITNNLGAAYKEPVGSQGPSPRLNLYTLALDFVF